MKKLLPKIKIEDSLIWKTWLLCLIMGIVTFVPYIIQDGGILTLCDDYNTQMIPFATALNNSLKSGEGSWQWNIGLGAQRLGGNSYYYLGSPFFYVSMLFPGSWFPYIVGPLYILKYAFAGMFAYMYLRKFPKNKLCAVIGAVLYAFSGFQSINLEFYIFHDIVAFFPLLMIGVDELYEKDKKNLFIFAVALNCILNYFCFFGEVLFLLIYVLFRFPRALGKDKFIKQSWMCILCGIIGMGVVSMIFIPSAIYTFGNPRVLPDIIRMLHKRFDIWGVLKGMLMPAEAMNNYSIIAEANWNSVCCYIPLIGMSLTIPYVIKKRDWLSKILIFFFIASFFPVAVSAFYIFTNPYYRWWYMFILLMLVAAVQVLDEIQEYPVKISTYIYGAISVGFVAIFWIGDCMGKPAFTINRPKIYMLLTAIVVGSTALTIIMLYQKNKRIEKYLVLAVILGICTTSVAVTLYRKTTHEENYKSYFGAGLSLEACDPQYRYAECDNLLTYPGKANGIGTFNSTISNAIRDFEEIFDYVSISTNLNGHSYEGLTELMAGRYEVTRDEHCYESFSIVEREACPIGYYYDNYMTIDELMTIDLEKRGYGLLRDIVLRDKELAKLEGYVTHDDTFGEAQNTTVHEYVEVNSSHKVDNFKRIKNGYTCTTDSPDDHVYFFSVPYDYGWRCYIDGEEQDVLYATGFSAVAVPGGEHTLVFQFRSFGLILGTVMCVMAIAGWILLYRSDKKKAMKADSQNIS